MWDKSIPAKKKIREIEEGMQPDTIDIIQNPIRAKNLYQNLLKNASQERMIIFPTINAYIRQDRIGIIKLLKKVAKKYNI
ncbi:MAG: hypothetical protein H0X03_09650 [Nitrosopumilus sp.]|nr:hypothetical protein [Nitrosopumilus sp.]